MTALMPQLALMVLWHFPVERSQSAHIVVFYFYVQCLHFAEFFFFSKYGFEICSRSATSSVFGDLLVILFIIINIWTYLLDCNVRLLPWPKLGITSDHIVLIQRLPCLVDILCF